MVGFADNKGFHFLPEFLVWHADDGGLQDTGVFDEAVFDFTGVDEQLMTFARYLPGDPAIHGQLVKTDDGAWAFSYEAGDDDDERIVGLDSHSLSAGNYLTVVQGDGEEHVYRVAAVTDRVIA